MTVKESAQPMIANPLALFAIWMALNQTSQILVHFSNNIKVMFMSFISHFCACYWFPLQCYESAIGVIISNFFACHWLPLQNTESAIFPSFFCHFYASYWLPLQNNESAIGVINQSFLGLLLVTSQALQNNESAIGVIFQSFLCLLLVSNLVL